MKKIAFLILLLLFIPQVNALDIHLFYSELCSTCEEEIKFLEEYKKEADINIIYYETTRNKENDELLSEVRKALNNNDKTVPYTVIGTTGITGFNETVKNQIKSAYEFYTYEFVDIVDVIQNDLDVEYEIIPPEGQYNLPILGDVNPEDVSLPLVATVIGFIDGFNPCAMWILLFLINMLFGMKNKKRMLFLGISFLAVSALVYFLSMLGLTTIFSFISIPLIRSIIGLIALIVGLYNIRKYFITKNSNEGCHVVNETKRKKVFKRIKKFTTEQNLILAFIGVVILAVSVNIIELACSTVFPATFAEILAINNITGIERIIYLLVYTLFYMIDDMVIFIIAVSTLTITTASSKYGKYSSLLAGIIMILMGILLMFKPEWVMFNF